MVHNAYIEFVKTHIGKAAGETQPEKMKNVAEAYQRQKRGRKKGTGLFDSDEPQLSAKQKKAMSDDEEIADYVRQENLNKIRNAKSDSYKKKQLEELAGKEKSKKIMNDLKSKQLKVTTENAAKAEKQKLKFQQEFKRSKNLVNGGSIRKKGKGYNYHTNIVEPDYPQYETDENGNIREKTEEEEGQGLFLPGAKQQRGKGLIGKTIRLTKGDGFFDDVVKGFKTVIGKVAKIGSPFLKLIDPTGISSGLASSVGDLLGDGVNAQRAKGRKRVRLAGRGKLRVKG